jgi:hypothetical protein
VSKEEVDKFNMTELKSFIKKNKIDFKNASYKEDFVKIVFKYLKEESPEESSEEETEEESEEESEEETGGDDDEWEYYYTY